MSFSTDKALLIDVIKLKSCTETRAIQGASNYSQLLTMFFQFAGLFDCDIAYLEEILDLFDDSILLANGIYYNKTGASVDNPKAVVKSTYTTININAGGSYGPLEILDGSIITKLNITNSTNVLSLGISGASEVGILTVASGSCIDTVVIKGCQGNNSKLDKIIEGSCINDLGVDANATFNGYICDLTEL